MPREARRDESAPREIERKFLVSGDDWRSEVRGEKRIRQAYLALTDKVQIRVRLVDEGAEAKARLTIKSARATRERAEYEYDIPVSEAETMLALAATAVLEKTRFIVPAGDEREWEIDRFEGPHEGLVLAEIELEEEDADIDFPGWVGREVTGDDAYYNAALACAPETPATN